MQLEGRNALLEAIKSETTIDMVYVASGLEGSANEIISKLKEKQIKYKIVDKKVLDSKSQTGKHQGFIASVSEFEYTEIDEIVSSVSEKGGTPFLVILDGILDPHNLGSIIRTCECAGVNGLIIGKNRSASVNETVIRVSQGASSYVKIARVVNVNDAIRYLKDQGIFVMGAESEGTSITKANLKGSIAIVIGSEGEGMSSLTKRLCDDIISIPMFGQINSLNAGVACGIVLYEVVRQNGK